MVSGNKYFSVLELSKEWLSEKATERSYNTSSIWGLIVSQGRFVWLYNSSPSRDYNLLIYPTYTWGVFRAIILYPFLFKGEEVWDDNDLEAFEEFMPCLHQDSAGPNLLSTNASSTEQQYALISWLVRFLLALRAFHFLPDVVITLLAKFFCKYFSVLGRYSDFAAAMAEQMPSSLYQLECYVN